jgi:hypothetical protein
MTEQPKQTMERRRYPRTNIQMKLQCIRLDPDGGDVVDLIDTIDISRGGLGAYCDRPFYPGQRILVCLPMTTVGGRRNVHGSIVRCRVTEDGYNVGICFDQSGLGVCDADETAVAA